jgi:hypothetical protein
LVVCIRVRLVVVVSYCWWLSPFVVFARLELWGSKALQLWIVGEVLVLKRITEELSIDVVNFSLSLSSFCQPFGKG